MTLLQKQCDFARTQMITILMLAIQNTKLAGYMLTGNRSGHRWKCRLVVPLS